MDEKSAVMDSLGKSKAGKKVKKHVHEMRIERGASGGFAVHHTMKDKEGNHHGTNGPHIMANADQLHDHVDAMMGDQPASGQEPDADDASGIEGEAGPQGAQ